MKKIALILGILIFLGFIGFNQIQSFYAPPSGPQSEEVIFIPPGSPLGATAQLLQDQGVIKSAWKLKLLARFKGESRNIKPGEYKIKAPTSPSHILDILKEGKVLLHKVTFPEGITVKEVAQILEQRELVDAERFKTTLEDLSLLNRWGISSPTYEGFLFPDTYFFSKTEGEEKVVDTMLEHFQNALTAEDRLRMEDIGGDLLSWATLASIIEKESSDPKEHPLISSVFYNRLRKNMRLQSDPTVIYGIPNFDGNLTKKHLQDKSNPFNTYMHRGLPPHPIANPSASALHAAMNPAKTKFLYFVAKKDGTHAFAKTYKEHQKNVRKYQLRRRKK